MDFFIFRHGETYFSKFDVSYGDMMESAEILPEGIPTIERLGKYMKDVETDANFSSPYLRCRQTVEIIERIAHKKFVYEERLKDMSQDKETIESMIKRISGFYKELIKEKYNSVAICSHGYPINVLSALATKGRVNNTDLYNYPQSGVLVIIKNKKKEYLDFNR
jgi:broad specificity phosphatase PhoE